MVGWLGMIWGGGGWVVGDDLGGGVVVWLGGWGGRGRVFG